MRTFFGQAVFKQVSKSLRQNRMTEIVSLRFFALMSSKKGQFFWRFHAFGDHSQFKASPHTDYGGNDGLLGSGGDLANERLIDFQRVDREFSQVAQAGLAWPEIIDGHLHTSSFWCLQDCFGGSARFIRTLSVSSSSKYFGSKPVFLRIAHTPPENARHGTPWQKHSRPSYPGADRHPARNLSLLGANERQNISGCTGGIEPDLFCRAPRSESLVSC
jgi:hypothetical protein